MSHSVYHELSHQKKYTLNITKLWSDARFNVSCFSCGKDKIVTGNVDCSQLRNRETAKVTILY